jgi:hypothetical protein
LIKSPLWPAERTQLGHFPRTEKRANSRPNGNLRNEVGKARDISATNRMQLDDDHGVRAPHAPQHSGLPAREARHGDRSSREHENSKNLPAGSNPFKRHLVDRGIIVTSDQERKTRAIAAIQIKAIPGRWVHSEKRGLGSQAGGATMENALSLALSRPGSAFWSPAGGESAAPAR